MHTPTCERVTGSWTASEAVVFATRQLREAGIESPGLDARLLVGAALGLRAEQLIARPDLPVGPEAQKTIEGYLNRRLAHEPVSRILGSRGFYGRMFEISPATLDPRPETETLIEAALGLVNERKSDPAKPIRILDIGTGSGCLLITLLAELPNSIGLGTDISVEALEIARRNALKHAVKSRAEFRLARSLEGIAGPFDLVVANPPYIPTGDIEGLAPEVRDFDPRSALDGGVDGLDVYREIAKNLVRVVPEGWAIFEVGAGQATAVAKIVDECRVETARPQIRTFRDLLAVDRCVAWKARS